MTRKPRSCADCQIDITGQSAWRCDLCLPVHKQRKQAEYTARSQANLRQREVRRVAYMAAAPERERLTIEHRAKLEADRAARLLKSRTSEGSAARRAAVAGLSAEPLPARRAPAGSHSWAIVRVKELESGELYPVRWRCRDCATIKTIEASLRPRYEFPVDLEPLFPDGFPDPGSAGRCPFGVPSPKRRSWRDWGDP